MILLNAKCQWYVVCIPVYVTGMQSGAEGKVHFLHQVFKRIHDSKENKEPIKSSYNIDYYSHFIVREN